MADTFEWPDDAKVMEMIAKRVDALSGVDPRGDDGRKSLKKLMVMVWHLLPVHDRDEFIARCSLDDLSFDMKPMDIKTILGAWWVVMENLPPRGWDYDFALDVEKRRKQQFWRPKGRQEEQTRRIFEEAQIRKGINDARMNRDADQLEDAE